ncbi:MAG: exo-alpha-sialidase [Proteobacteria bacterium]|nr:exo-alpha-sialidase [Pseudomonadota bacterium]
MFFRKNQTANKPKVFTGMWNAEQNQHVTSIEGFPKGSHVFGITTGPQGEIMVGAGNPETAEGTLSIRQANGTWSSITLPDETAWLSQFVRLEDGSYVASGMTLLGRAAILKGDATATQWTSIDMDLHSFCQINALIQLPNGDLLAATGAMITQGKTKPILLRSKDGGLSWEKEEVKLPITQFHTFNLDGTRLYAGTCGDHSPVLYTSDDFGVTWNLLPQLPSYKTYKTIALQPIMVGGEKRILAVMWGYKIDIADRVVRLYVTDSEGKNWNELPEVLDSHFLFSFYVAPDSTFYAGSEKGMFLRSKDLGATWEKLARFPTNIGAYAIHQHNGKIWLGKDFVEPDFTSLWTVNN